ncbi:hypothetical protein QBC36DRAFT_316440 [Triangularia setosa]|uniref:Uncharacterized protein n=1 Tax=Triangularia setosa TaxID=2587417 RepID=A0AAN6VW31_9PEZI|nr:hypothetical protein QBC36DRAFT_316440 [Podospora setosa]
MDSEEEVKKLCNTLSGLLRGLALKIGHDASSQMHRDVMVFIHRNRGRVVEVFKELLNRRSADSTVDDARSPMIRAIPQVQEATSTFILDRFMQETPDIQPGSDVVGPAIPSVRSPSTASNTSESADIIMEETNSRGADNEESEVPGMQYYTDTVSNDPGYDWLLSRLERELALSIPSDMFQRRQRILSMIPYPRKMSRRVSSATCVVTFIAEWDPRAFLAEQEHVGERGLSVSFSRLITITTTGSSADGQALSCLDYMEQTWPKTGGCTVQLITKLLTDTLGDPVTYIPIPGLSISGHFEGDKTIVEASGVPEFVVEIGEQLAWLGSAIRSAPISQTDGPVYLCVPYHDNTAQPAPRFPQSQQVHCFIKYKFESDGGSLPGNLSGRCWYNMFNGAVIAKGFPIRRRQRSDTGIGLEMPLNMMAALTRTSYVNTFGSKTKVFIKGFSAMLIPTGKQDDILIWHLCQKRNPSERISYLDVSVDHIDVRVLELEGYRHVVGWCSEVKSHIGASTANLDISRSNLPYSPPSHRLDRFELSTGHLVNFTGVFAIGRRESPIHISRFPYDEMVKWISSKYFVFWDEADHRGWLVDGAGALLHLLRGSLSSETKGPTWDQGNFIVDSTVLSNSLDTTKSGSAFNILMNYQTRSLPLYANKPDIIEEIITEEGKPPRTVRTENKTYYHLQSRIEQLSNELEKLIERQIDVERRDGVDITPRLRRFLDGWEFKDIVAKESLVPRQCILPTIGKGWVDFVRGIRAVTIFGKGFGNLFEPGNGTTLSSSLSLCYQWNQVPKDRYYLAARVQDLRYIMADHGGDETTNPKKICTKLLWLMNGKAFGPCTCGRHPDKHTDAVQAFLPDTFLARIKKKPSFDLAPHTNGAVILGHNRNLRFEWGDTGHPNVTDKTAAVNEDNITTAVLTTVLREDSSTTSALSTITDQSSSAVASSSVPSLPARRQPR